MYERKIIPNINCGLDLMGEALYTNYLKGLSWQKTRAVSDV